MQKQKKIIKKRCKISNVHTLDTVAVACFVQTSPDGGGSICQWYTVQVVNQPGNLGTNRYRTCHSYIVILDYRGSTLILKIYI